MGGFSDKAEDWLKDNVCDKQSLPHMQREVRLPSCLQFCVELCGGKKCQNKCNKVLRFGQLWIKVTDVIFIVATQWWLQPGQAQSGQPGLQQVERGGAPIPSRICEV